MAQLVCIVLTLVLTINGITEFSYFSPVICYMYVHCTGFRDHLWNREILGLRYRVRRLLGDQRHDNFRFRRSSFRTKDGGLAAGRSSADVTARGSPGNAS